MSYVTNVIITTSLSEDRDYLSEKFRQYRVNGLSFNITSVENEKLPKYWYGGNKMLEVNIFIGAFNYLNLDSLLEYLKEEIRWDSPFSVQVLAKEQNDLKFKVIDLFVE